MSKKKISKSKHNRESAGQTKFWQRKQIRVFLIVLLAVVVVAVAIFIFDSSRDKNPVKTDHENETSSNITGSSGQTADNIVISNVSVSDVTETSITATWTTNVPATSELHVSRLGNDTVFSNYPDKTLVSEHKATITELSPFTAYKLKVVSADASGKKVEFEIEQAYTTRNARTTIGIFVGDRIPDFSLQSTTGETVSSASFAGKQTLIFFWEFSCNSCKAELPYINDFYNNLADRNIEVLTISTRERPELIKVYLESEKFTFPVLLDPDGNVADKFTIATFPTSFLIDPSGNIAKIKEGTFKNTGEINEFIDQLTP